ncbi:unnamed protein product [Mytilus coruscus]|uniref:Peptidase C14 caspase domain-containing protein n=1 Tax=Mytilus coruscus TaxID=42192 RepID=A0A6J8CPS2_MYTCO|nr:unnamed protein product [Mytilus coruscus]
MEILAKIFPLNENSVGDNYEKFNSFWSQVEGCEVEEIDIKNYDPPRKVKDFEKQLEGFIEKFKAGKYKYLVLAVSSHGIEQEQKTYGKESNKKEGVEVTFEIAWKSNRYEVNELLRLFKEVKEQKIFIMQMCRNRSDKTTVTKHGNDVGVMHHSNTEPRLQQTLGELTTGARGKSQSSEALNRVSWPTTWKLAQPCIRDSIVMFSSPSGYVSYGNINSPNSGGWIFVNMEELLESLKGKTISVIDLFLMVNQKMSETFTISIIDGWLTALLNWPPVELTAIKGQLRASWPSVEQIVEGQLKKPGFCHAN